MAYPSPHAGYYGYPDTTPSPPGHGYTNYRPGTSFGHRQPHSRTRNQSHDFGFTSPAKNYPSPRYSSSGQYSTRTPFASPGAEAEYVSSKSRKTHTHRHGYSWSTPHAKPSRRFSKSYRAPYGDSDEDEFFEIDGEIYVLRARGRAKDNDDYYYDRGHGTNRYYQGYPRDREGTPVVNVEPASTPRPEFQTPPRRERRASTSVPQRPATTVPRSTPKKAAPPPTPVATAEDAKLHGIPAGYSLKNWDPTEEPITLLGSVFDANSLGKWIYDWTVYRHGPATPIADVAGELWLLLIQLAGKVKRAEECMPRIRSKENRLMVEDFMESGERLMDKLQKLLKACEKPMLTAGKRGKETAQLGKNAGTEFVDSIFGRDRQLENTEKFMASIRLWNLRFDANCEDILRKPHA
jgi:hypothetical protein